MELKNKVERIDVPTKEGKPVEFTHCLCVDNGWVLALIKPENVERVVYLGNCAKDGDMFSCYHKGWISIFKGHINSGKY